MQTPKVQEVHASINRISEIASMPSVMNAEFKLTDLAPDELQYFADTFDLPIHNSGVAESKCVILPIKSHVRVYIMQRLD